MKGDDNVYCKLEMHHFKKSDDGLIWFCCHCPAMRDRYGKALNSDVSSY